MGVAWWIWWTDARKTLQVSTNRSSLGTIMSPVLPHRLIAYCCLALPVDALSIPMVEALLGTPLVSKAGSAPLRAPRLLLAHQAAIALASVAVRANEEQRPTARSSAESLAEGFFVSRHRQRQTLSNHRKS